MKIRHVFYVSVEPSEVTNQVVGDYVMDIVSVDPGNLILCWLIHFVQPVPVNHFAQLLSNVYLMVICCHALVFCKVDDCCAVISHHLDRA
jgi:hypothetical protein